MEGWLPPDPARPAQPPPPPPPPAETWKQPAWPPPQGWTHAPQDPENKPANVGFAFSITAAGLLVMSLGLFGVLTLPLAIVGWTKGREGMRRVESGETHIREGLARAAVVIGIVSTVLSVLAIAGLIVLIAASPEGFDGN
jgi:hypothetical protein